MNLHRRRAASYPEAIVEVKEHVRRDELRRELYRLTETFMNLDPECRRHMHKRCDESGCVCGGASFAFRIALETVAHHLEVSYGHSPYEQHWQET